MKNIKFLFLALALSVATSCSDLTELNQDPTRATSMDPNLIIPTIQLSHSLGYNNCARYIFYPGAWVNHWTAANALVEWGGKGQKNLPYMERLWTILFPEAVRNLGSLEFFTENKPEMANLYAISKVLRVETYLKLTDYYGDIPYFEGGKGYYEGKISPKYDKQEDIYKDFFVKLDEAIALFSNSLPIAKNDLYFNGDVEKWKRFANSLKLRIAMRLVKVDPEMAKEKAREAFQSGIMTSNNDIAAVKHQDDQQDVGPGNGYARYLSTYNSGYGPSVFRLTTELFRALTVMDTDSVVGNVTFRRLKAKDARLLFIARSYNATTYDKAVDITELCRAWNAKAPGQQGPADLTKAVDGYINIGGYLTTPAQDFGYGGGIQREFGVEKTRSVWAAAITTAQVPAMPSASTTHYIQRLQPSKFLQAADSPWIHMSYAETQFLMAETTLRGWNIDTESAESRFRKGYEAAVKQWSLFKAPVPSDAQINSYLDNHLIPILGQGTTPALEEVSKQIWILHVMDPIEAWSHIRRTNGMPTAYTQYYNRYPTQNTTDGKAPRRMQYPLEEQTKNKKNYDEVVARMGGADDWMTPMWWDVQ